MARVTVQHNHNRAHQGAHGSSALDRTRAARKKRPYKVVMEVVTQEKKKLRSVLTYTDSSPRGYTFVPLGHPDLTEYCKETCRRRGREAHIVTAKPKGKHQDSHSNGEAPHIDTQRIGHHFPNEVLDEACDVLGYIFRHGEFQKSTRNYEETRLARSLRDYGQRMRLHGRPMTDGETREQIRSAVLEVFPKIPEADLNSIVSHAFEEGTNRVGNAKGLTLARRVQLAVGAYIRHQYTNYDTILKTGGTWPEARSQVQPISYAKLKEWRDEADDSKELEEAFREIIVLDDEDDDSDTDATSSADEHDQDLEIVSTRATARELQADDRAYVTHVENGVGANRVPRRRIVLRPISSAYVSSPIAHPMRQMTRAQSRPLPPSPRTRIPLEHRQLPAREPSFVVSRRPMEPQRVQGNDGKLYDLLPIGPGREPYTHARINSLENSSSRPAALPFTRRSLGDDVVLPSVERESDSLTLHSPQRRAVPTRAYAEEYGKHEPVYKRLRPVHGDDMSVRLHRREPLDIQHRPRMYPDDDIIGPVSNFHRPPSRDVYVVSDRVSAPHGSSDHSYMPPPRGAYAPLHMDIRSTRSGLRY